MDDQSRNRPQPSRSLGTLWRGTLLLAAGALIGGGVAVAHNVNAASNHSASQQNTSTRSAASVPVPPSDKLREQAITKVDKAVVKVTNVGIGLGSGVTISSDGYIVTNYHVVAKQHSLTVTLANGKTVTAKLVGTDSVDDIAVVKVSGSNLPTASFGDSSQLRLGQSVLAIGNPLGIGSTVTDGIVSALNRTVSEGQGNTNGSILKAIQTSAPINPGNSGGALVNLAGQVVGIPTLTAVDPEFNAPASGVGFAIPSNLVQNLANQIIKHGHVVHSGRAYLGVGTQPVTPQAAQANNLPIDHGVAIVQVQQGGPAAKAGLRAGDIIVKMGNTDVYTYSDLLTAISNAKPGQSVTIGVVTQNNQHKSYKVTLGEFPIPSSS